MREKIYDALVRAAEDLVRNPQYWGVTTYNPLSGQRCVLSHLVGPANLPGHYKSMDSVLMEASRRGMSNDVAIQVIHANDRASSPDSVLYWVRRNRKMILDRL